MLPSIKKQKWAEKETPSSESLTSLRCAGRAERKRKKAHTQNAETCGVSVAWVEEPYVREAGINFEHIQRQ